MICMTRSLFHQHISTFDRTNFFLRTHVSYQLSVCTLIIDQVSKVLFASVELCLYVWMYSCLSTLKEPVLFNKIFYIAISVARKHKMIKEIKVLLNKFSTISWESLMLDSFNINYLRIIHISYTSTENENLCDEWYARTQRPSRADVH